MSHTNLHFIVHQIIGNGGLRVSIVYDDFHFIVQELWELILWKS